MPLKHLIILALVTLVASDVPDVPNSFSADVVATLPFIGKVPAKMYYDYPNLRQRLDFSQFGSNFYDLYRYDLKEEFQVYGGQCQSSDLNDEMYPMSIPPIATFDGTQNINGVPADHWFVNLGIFGVKMDYYVVNITQDARDYPTILRFVGTASGMSVQYDFKNVVPGPQADSLFDWKQFGCPNPTPPPTYSFSGYVKNGLNNALVTSGQAKASNGATVNIDSSGKYTFTGFTVGNYSVTVTSNGYFPSTVNFYLDHDIPAGTTIDVVLSPTIPSGTIRAILTWGAYPRDLDSHLRVPGGCDVYFGRKTCTTGSSVSTLDVDATAGYGPETITMKGYNSVTGEFTYYVYIYSSDSQFTNSNARVQVYDSQGLAHDLRVPTSGYTVTNRFWKVFTVDGPTGAITIVNEVVPSV